MEKVVRVKVGCDEGPFGRLVALRPQASHFGKKHIALSFTILTTDVSA